MQFCSPRVLYQLAFLVHLRSSLLVKTFAPTYSTIKRDDCVKSNINSNYVHQRDSRERIFHLGWSFIPIVSISSPVRSLFGIEFVFLVVVISIFHNGFFELVGIFKPPLGFFPKIFPIATILLMFNFFFFFCYNWFWRCGCACYIINWTIV